MQFEKHNYHLVDPSPWPALGSFGVIILAFGAVSYFGDGLTFGAEETKRVVTTGAMAVGALLMSGKINKQQAWDLLFKGTAQHAEGIVDVNDLLILIDHIVVDQTQFNPFLADINSDGIVNIQDLI